MKKEAPVVSLGTLVVSSVNGFYWVMVFKSPELFLNELVWLTVLFVLVTCTYVLCATLDDEKVILVIVRTFAIIFAVMIVLAIVLSFVAAVVALAYYAHAGFFK